MSSSKLNKFLWSQLLLQGCPTSMNPWRSCVLPPHCIVRTPTMVSREVVFHLGIRNSPSSKVPSLKRLKNGHGRGLMSMSARPGFDKLRHVSYISSTTGVCVCFFSSSAVRCVRAPVSPRLRQASSERIDAGATMRSQDSMLMCLVLLGILHLPLPCPVH